MDYEYCVFIGRFQPLHKSHLAVLEQALQTAKQVVVVIGSIDSAENIKNPWSFEERKQMILDCLPNEASRLQFVGAVDHFYNDNAWIVQVQQKVHEATKGSDSVALIGTYKDESSYYIKCFPQWDEIIAKPNDMMSATDVRDVLFDIDRQTQIDTTLDQYLPLPVQKYLMKYLLSPRHMNLREEYKFIKDYRDKWKGAPFVPTFNTVDAVCIQSGHVLVVKRKFHPGKGLWALPGGFIKQNETLKTAAIRELKEETGVKVSKDELGSNIKYERTFDYPNRSLRGRTITQAFCIHLPDGTLPEVKGNDDAAAAKWLSLYDFNMMRNMFYEDHAHIIDYFVRKF